MSYQVLARKWRPKNFAQLMGQEHVVAVLTNALRQQRLHHAYLFTGTRGVGKTTIARIFAKSLNCTTGVTAQPCGICDACVDIDQGRFVDLLEIDAASRTKVDDTREILDNVQYAPTRGRYKVYLIDEVHMLSRSSFNALLKTLEEPPEHVKFILATTDPKKLPITVLSRCLQFHLKSLTVEQINQQLQLILEKETVTAEPGAVRLLAKAAQGSMRDSLSLTDQAIAQGQGHLTVANIQQMLGGVDQNWAYKILIALIKQDSKALMTLSLDIASYAPNYSRLLAEIIQLLHQVALSQIVETTFDLIPEHQVLLAKFIKLISPEDVQLYYQIALNGRKDLPYAMDEQAAFDMVLLRMLAFQPQKHASSLTADDKPVSNEKNMHEENLADLNLFKPTQVSSSAQKTPIADEQPSKETDNESEAVLAAQLAGIELQAQSMLNCDASMHQNVEKSSIIELSQGDNHLPKTQVPFEADNETNGHNDECNQLSNALTDDVGVPENIPELHTSSNALAQDTHGQVTQQQNALSNNNLEQSLQEHNQQENSSQKNLTNEDVTEPLPESSPVAAVLASRNMLRSRKKAMEKDEKKSNDALKRQSGHTQSLEIPADVPDLDTLPEIPYQPEVIDPAVVTKANQIDKWANMIDSMSLGGRLRQLAIHSTISEHSTDDYLLLQLNQSTKHLQSDAAHKQLEIHLCQLLNRQISVEIEVVEATKDDPFQIQTEINEKRYDYAKDLLQSDEIISQLQNLFGATLDESTIAAR